MFLWYQWHLQYSYSTGLLTQLFLAVCNTVNYAVSEYVGSVFDFFQWFAVDFGRHIGDVEEVDVWHVSRSASPPFTARQDVSVDNDVRRPDVPVHSQEAEILQERHVAVGSDVVRSKHDVMYDVWYHETLSIIENINSLPWGRAQ